MHPNPRTSLRFLWTTNLHNFRNDCQHSRAILDQANHNSLELITNNQCSSHINSPFRSLLHNLNSNPTPQPALLLIRHHTNLSLCRLPFNSGSTHHSRFSHKVSWCSRLKSDTGCNHQQPTKKTTIHHTEAARSKDIKPRDTRCHSSCFTTNLCLRDRETAYKRPGRRHRDGNRRIPRYRHTRNSHSHNHSHNQTPCLHADQRPRLAHNKQLSRPHQ